MNKIIEKLENDKELEKFYAMSEAESEAYLKDILEFADNNKDEFIAYCHTIEPTQFCNLAIIYETLAEAPQRWGDFFADEHDRIIAYAKKSGKPFQSITCLEEAIVYEDKHLPFADRIIRTLAAELDNPIDAFRHRAVYFLSNWIDDDNKTKYRQVLKKMKERLTDTNWKIRWITNFVIREGYDFDASEVKISWWDRIRGKYFLTFGNPFEIEEK